MATDGESGFGGTVSGTTSTGGQGVDEDDYDEQVIVDGELGTHTYRRDMEPEIGDGQLMIVAEFQSVMDFEGEPVKGPVSVGHDKSQKFISEIKERLGEYELYWLRPGGSVDRDFGGTGEQDG
jgi:hypothetical protein